MKLTSIGTVIATRKLALNGKYVVKVEIGKPRKFRKFDDYYCPYLISGLGKKKIRYAGGVDPIQALMLALQAAGTNLYTSKEYKAGALSLFAGDKVRDLGFPIADSIKDLYPAGK